ncbi:MAG TPA: heme-copper oxidase subunit III [Ktedonobacterales bacterium]|nr:heme-copper oxidase subunit III [Ktedonobacterales bacterium]
MSTVISQETITDHESEPQGRSFGWYGMVFFLASEAVFFANLIAAYLYLRVRAGAWPPTAEHLTRPEVLIPGINTLILLSSSFPMHFAARAITKGDKRGLTIGLGLTALLGSIFLGGQAYEYVHNAFGPSTGVFGSTFYTLTGFHGAHVTFGVIFLLITFIRSMRGDFTKNKHFGVNAVEMYWHFVDAVWIILFLTVYIL